MLNSPVVSVIIPTFNRLPYLKCALRSVEEQTFRNLEVVVLDDGSTDGTLGFLRGYASGFSLRWFSFQHKERSYLRNFGAQEAKGDYLAFLDDDDEWAPEKLETQISFLAQHQEISMIHCFTSVIDENGQGVRDLTEEHKHRHQWALKKGYTYELMSLVSIIFTSAVVVRKAVFIQEKGFDESVPPLEDWDLYLRISKSHQITAIPRELVRYRIHPNQSQFRRMALARLAVARKHLVEEKTGNGKGNTSRMSRLHFLINLAEASFMLGDHQSCRRWFFEIFRMNPLALVRPVWGSYILLPHFLLSCLPERWGLWIRGKKSLELNFP